MSRFLSELANCDPDELFLLLLSAVIVMIGLFRWTLRLRRVSKLGAAVYHRVPLYLAFALGFGLFAWAVNRWSAEEVRASSVYTSLMLLMGAAWVILATAFFPWLGVGLRDDALERRNFAAVLALSGAVLGFFVSFAGANVGEGPSFWNNVFAGGLASGSLLLVWFGLTIGGGTAASVAEERDIASGIRLGGFLIAEGLILGRAVAGDWHSASGTVNDLVKEGWPAVVLMLLAILVEQWLRPTHHRSNSSAALGLVPAAGYLLAAGAWVLRLGWWEGALS